MYSYKVCLVTFVLLNGIRSDCAEGTLSCDPQGDSPVATICDFKNSYQLTELGKCQKREVEGCELPSFSEASAPCFRCQEGLVLDIEGQKCVTVADENKTENCLRYDGLSSLCVLCKPHFYLNGPDCSPVSVKIKNCLMYESEKTCLQCDNIFRLQENKCVGFLPVRGCQIHRNLVCDRCKSGYHLGVIKKTEILLNDHFFQTILESDFSDSHWAPDNKIPFCQKNIIPKCLKYENSEKCLKCETGNFVTREYQCQPNPKPSFAKCERYADINDCRKCRGANHLFGNPIKCTPSEVVPHCKTYGTYLDKCVLCDDNFYLNKRNNTCNKRDNQMFEHCEGLDPEADSCKGCTGDMILTQDLKTCLPNIEKCLEIELAATLKDSEHKCIKCRYKHAFIDQTCVETGDPFCMWYKYDKCVQCDPLRYVKDNKCELRTSPNCVNWKGFDSNQCLECSKNFYADENGDCQPRDKTNCFEYEQLTNNCIHCEHGNYLDSAQCKPQAIPHCNDYITMQNICTNCSAGYFLKDNACPPVSVQNCIQYSPNTNNCLKCSRGHYLGENNSCLNQEQPFCLDYDLDLNTCVDTGCQQGYFWNGSECEIQDQPKCIKYEHNTNICTGCQAGYWLDGQTCVIQMVFNCIEFETNSPKCVKCAPFSYFFTFASCSDVNIDNCISIDAANVRCLECQVGYYLNFGVCKKNNKLNCIDYIPNTNDCTACADGFYPHPRFRTCLPLAASGCVKHDNSANCLECQAGYTSTSNGCSKNNIPNCIQYENMSICTVCEEGYSVNHFKRCSKITFDNCVSFEPLTGKCIHCQAGYFLDNTDLCKIQSVQGCIEYKINLNECVTCSATHVFISPSECRLFDLSNCVDFDPVGTCVGCKPHQYLDAAVCKSRDKTGCLKYTGSTNDCRSCDARYFLDGTSCVKYDTPQCMSYETTSANCKQCNFGYYLEANVCKAALTPNCIQYDTGNLKNCSICAAGYYLDLDFSCKLWNVPHCIWFKYNTNYCKVCTPGYKLVDNVCEKLIIPGCIKYDSDEKCVTCAKGYFKVDDVTCGKEEIANCVEYSIVNWLCLECAFGFWWNAAANSSAGNCDSQDIRGCTLFKYNLNECTKCQAGMYLSGTTCLDQTIDNCIEYDTNANTCTQCAMGWYPNGNTECKLQDNANCIDFTVDTNECIKCETGYRLNSKACDLLNIANCILHDNTTGKCLICRAGYRLNASKTCESPVINNCLSYTDNLNKCGVCRANYFLSADKTYCIMPNKTRCTSYSNRDGKCNKCELHGFLVNNTQCNAKTYIDHCVRYKENHTKCQTCQGMFYYHENHKKCYNRTAANCRTVYDNQNKCKICRSNAFRDSNGNSCKNGNIRYCTAYESNVTKCRTCKTRWKPNSNKTACIINNDICKEYKNDDGTTICNKCANLYFLNLQSKCVKITKFAVCGLSDGLIDVCILCKTGKFGVECDQPKTSIYYGSNCLNNDMLSLDTPQCNHCKPGFVLVDGWHFVKDKTYLNNQKCTHLVDNVKGICRQCLEHYERTLPDADSFQCTKVEHTYFQACDKTKIDSVKPFTENRDCVNCQDYVYYYLQDEICKSRSENLNMNGCEKFKTNSKECKYCKAGQYQVVTTGYEECVTEAQIAVIIENCLQYLDLGKCRICTLGKMPNNDGSACVDIDPDQYAWTKRAYNTYLNSHGPVIDSAQKVTNCAVYSQVFLDNLGCTKCKPGFVGILDDSRKVGIKDYAFTLGKDNMFGVDDVVSVFNKCVPDSGSYLNSSDPTDKATSDGTCLIGYQYIDEAKGGFACIRCKNDHMGEIGFATHYPDGTLVPGGETMALKNCQTLNAAFPMRMYGGVFFNSSMNKGDYLTGSSYFNWDKCVPLEDLVYMYITEMEPLRIIFPKTKQSNGNPLKVAHCLASMKLNTVFGCRYYGLRVDFETDPDFSSATKYNNIICIMCDTGFQAINGVCVNRQSKCGNRFVDTDGPVYSKQFLGGCRKSIVTLAIDKTENLHFSFHINTNNSIQDCLMIDVNSPSRCLFYIEKKETWNTSTINRSMTSENGCKWRIGNGNLINEFWTDKETNMRTFANLVWRRYDTTEADFFDKDLPKGGCMKCNVGYEMNYNSTGTQNTCGTIVPEPPLPANCSKYDPNGIAKCGVCEAGNIINVNGICASNSSFDNCSIANSNHSRCEICGSGRTHKLGNEKHCVLKNCHKFDTVNPQNCEICSANKVYNGTDRRYCVDSSNPGDECSMYSLELDLCVKCKSGNPVYTFTKTTASDPPVSAPFHDSKICRVFPIDLSRYRSSVLVYFESTHILDSDTVKSEMFIVPYEVNSRLKFNLSIAPENFKNSHCMGTVPLPNCKYSEGAFCLTCKDYYFIKSDRLCYATQIPNCQKPVWTGTDEICQQCTFDYFAPDNITCTVRDISRYQICKKGAPDSDTCLFCHDDYLEVELACVKVQAQFCDGRASSIDQCSSCDYLHEFDDSTPKVCVLKYKNTIYAFCASMKADKSGCATCLTNYYLNGNNCSKTTLSKCESNVPNKNECASCTIRMKIKSDKSGCENKTATNCKVYHHIEDKCASCTYQYALVDGNCVKKDGPFCKTWSGSTIASELSKCQTCEFHHRIDPVSGTCVDKASTNCIEFRTDRDECTKCTKFYYHNGSSCIRKQNNKCLTVSTSQVPNEKDKCLTCTIYHHLNPTTKDCDKRSASLCDGYKTNGDACLACTDQNIMDGSSCILKTSAMCKAFSLGTVDSCATCGTDFRNETSCLHHMYDNCLTWDTATGKCDTCEHGYILQTSGECLSDFANNCRAFSSGAMQCDSCADQFMLDGDSKHCIPKTASYCIIFNSTQNQCLTMCNSGFSFDNANFICLPVTVSNCKTQIRNGNACKDCNPRFYLDQNNNCVKRTVLNCKSFTLSDFDQCQICEDGYVLESSLCVANTGNNCKAFKASAHGCDTCGDRFYLDASNNCVARDTDNCLTHKTGAFTGCETCHTLGWTKNGNSCDSKTKSECKTWDSVSDQCDTCGRNYFKSSPGNCTKRAATNCEIYTTELESDFCHSCKNGFFKTALNESCSKITKEHCLTYKDLVNECETCETGHFVKQGGECVRKTATQCAKFEELSDQCATCSKNYKMKAGKVGCEVKTAKLCATMDETKDECATCTDQFYKDATNCTQDHTGYCLKFKPNAKGCDECGKEYTLNANGTCDKNSQPLCKTFKDKTNECNTCDPDFFLNDSGQCLKNSGKLCRTFKNNDNGCLTCHINYTVNGLDCVPKNSLNCESFESASDRCDECSPTFIKDQSGICQPNNAENCTAFQEDSHLCISCAQGFYLGPGNKCFKVTAQGCKNFIDQQNLCDECIDDYHREANDCVPHFVANCAKYTPNEINSCEICDLGFHRKISAGKYKCFLNTVEGCMKFVGNKNRCHQCVNGFAQNQPDRTTLCLPYTAKNCETYQVRNDACQTCIKDAYQVNRENSFTKCRKRTLNRCLKFKKDEDACTQCFDDNYLDENGDCQFYGRVEHCLKYRNDANECKLCETGYYRPPKVNLCFINPGGMLGCTEYDSELICRECNEQNYLDREDNICKHIHLTIPDCQRYFDPSTCSKCPDNLLLYENECHVIVADHCQGYSSPTKCSSCLPNHLFSPTSGRCEHSGIQNCVSSFTQSGGTYCEICEAGYFLSQLQKSCESPTKPIDNCYDYEDDINQIICKHCQEGFVLNKERSKCQAIQELGLEFCARGFVLGHNVCQKCHVGFQINALFKCEALSLKNCAVAKVEDGSCKLCLPGSYMDTKGVCVGKIDYLNPESDGTGNNTRTDVGRLKIWLGIELLLSIMAMKMIQR